MTIAQIFALVIFLGVVIDLVIEVLFFFSVKTRDNTTWIKDLIVNKLKEWFDKDNDK